MKEDNNHLKELFIDLNLLSMKIIGLKLVFFLSKLNVDKMLKAQLFCKQLNISNP
jgi:hypothetical protein